MTSKSTDNPTQTACDARPVGPLTAVQLAAKAAFRCKVDTLNRKATEERWNEDRYDRGVFDICRDFKVDAVTYFEALNILATVTPEEGTP